MTPGSVIIFSGWAYAIAARVAPDTTEIGINKGRKAAWICTALGLLVDFTLIYLGV